MRLLGLFSTTVKGFYYALEVYFEEVHLDLILRSGRATTGIAAKIKMTPLKRIISP